MTIDLPRKRLPIGIQTFAKIREDDCSWYNGYNWTGESVYNPFDLLLLFQNRQFRPWWFETATPSFLIDLLVDREVFVPGLRPTDHERGAALDLRRGDAILTLNSSTIRIRTRCHQHRPPAVH